MENQVLTVIIEFNEMVVKPEKCFSGLSFVRRVSKRALLNQNSKKNMQI